MKILAEEKGQAAVLLATFLGLLALGFMAVAIDMGYFFHEKRMVQAAADAAAIAAEEEISANNSGNAQTVANAISKLNGFDPAASTHPATVTINTPPTSGTFANASGYTEAIVSRTIPTVLLGAFNHSMTGLTVSARAVAGGGQTSPTCICLESASGEDLNMSNSAQINAAGCGITVDSSSTNAVGVVGSANINALSLGTVSTTWNNSTNYGNNVNNGGSITSTTKQVTGVSACSPTITAPTLPTGITCYSNPIQGYILAPNYNANYTLPLEGASQMVNGNPVPIPNEVATNGVICYTSLNTSQAASVTFTPGYIYYIQGAFTTGGGAPLTGTGVTFYVGGNLTIANGVVVNLTAPTVNSVPGTLFYAMGNTVTIEGGSNSTLSGLVDAPNAAVTLDNGTNSTLTMDFVAQSLTMAGGAALNSYATTNMGTLNISVAKVAE